ncbi:JAB domain-containing protein [Chitinophaga agrisoli]|uniref:JAB domain-containing protein n=1 Tax=Chitinophaga agrisoli TaxID=2607653 RepID=A0A5B2VTE7_9BACT|nr:JAB domain-containing protein [Chitinophaga agrisoli]KAA2241517.1 JAB domain-containing protein [Chitinophaga agrisoli]
MPKSKIHSPFKVTEVQLTYRNKVKAADRPVIRHPEDAFIVLMTAWDENKIELLEEFKVLLLDYRNACLGITSIGSGTITECLVDPRLIFATALKARASRIILAHNHPSGNLKPSKADMSITRKLVTAGTYLDIAVADHLILNSETFLSMSLEGMMSGYTPH